MTVNDKTQVQIKNRVLSYMLYAVCVFYYLSLWFLNLPWWFPMQSFALQGRCTNRNFPTLLRKIIRGKHWSPLCVVWWYVSVVSENAIKFKSMWVQFSQGSSKPFSFFATQHGNQSAALPGNDSLLLNGCSQGRSPVRMFSVMVPT